MIAPPLGAVTLVFTDIEGSTALWEEDPASMAEALALHDAVLRELLAACRGYEVKTEGDAFMAAFADPGDAVRWCVEVQELLEEVAWPPPINQLVLRAGAHLGDPLARKNPVTGRMDYFGPDVNLAARVSSAAHGGQILVSGPTWDAVAGREDCEPTDLGPHRLKGLKGDVRLVQILPLRTSRRHFPPLRAHPGNRLHEQPSRDLDDTLLAAGRGLVARGQVRLVRGDLPGARLDLTAANATALAAGNAGQHRHARLLLARCRFDLEVADLEQLVADCAQAGDVRIGLRARLDLGQQHMRRRELDAAWTLATEVLDEAGPDHDAAVSAHALRCLVARAQGELEVSRAEAKAGLRRCETSGQRRLLGRLQVLAARSAVAFRDFAEAEALLEQAQHSVAISGAAEDEAWVWLELARIRLFHRDHAAALEAAETSSGLFERLENEAGRHRALQLRTLINAAAGHHDRARELGRELSAFHLPNKIAEAAVMMTLAIVHTAAGDHEQAGRILGPVDLADNHALVVELDAVRAVLGGAPPPSRSLVGAVLPDTVR